MDNTKRTLSDREQEILFWIARGCTSPQIAEKLSLSAEAIVEALVEQDIARARLTAVGKGSHVPIASNSTDEARIVE